MSAINWVLFAFGMIATICYFAQSWLTARSHLREIKFISRIEHLETELAALRALTQDKKEGGE